MRSLFKRQRNGREAGFSIVETMVIAAILAVTAAGVMDTLAESYRMNAFARETNVATEAMRNKIEDIRRVGYGGAAAFNNQAFTTLGISAQTGPDPDLYPSDPNYHGGLLAGTQNGYVTVAANATQADVSDVTVSIYWKGVLGNRMLTATTRITADD